MRRRTALSFRFYDNDVYNTHRRYVR